jgi:hypothetical protein
MRMLNTYGTKKMPRRRFRNATLEFSPIAISRAITFVAIVPTIANWKLKK